MARTIHELSDVVPLLAEVFRELGYEGASLSDITARTGLGKGSLYHFFPGGKEEMAAAVLAHVDDWFERNIYVPLREADAHVAVQAMWRAVDDYFRSGGRVCLVGAFALDDTRDQFAAAIRSYFERWIAALQAALIRVGCAPSAAQGHAEDAVFGIQGLLVLTRALNDTGLFQRGLKRMAQRLEDAIPKPKARKRARQQTKRAPAGS